MSLNEAAPEVEASLNKIKRKDRRAIKTEDYGSTSEALALAAECLPRLTQQIKTAIAKPERRHVRVVHALANLPHDKIALCVLQVALESVIRQQEEYIETANRIGSALFEEYWMHEWETTKRNLGNSNTKAAIKKRALFAKIEKVGVTKTYSQVQARVSTRNAAKYGFSPTDWSDAYTRAGDWAIDQLCAAWPEYFECKHVRTPSLSKKTPVLTKLYLRVTTKAEDFLNAAQLEIAKANPIWLNQIEKPLPWSGLNKGLTSDVRLAANVKLVKTRYEQTEKDFTDAINAGTMQPVLQALNRLQGVPWKINTRVLAVIKDCFEQGIEVKGLPRKKIPEPGLSTLWEEMSAEEQQTYIRRCEKVEDRNTSRIGVRTIFKQDMDTATRLAEHQRFYTPMNLDWRGRVYSLPAFNFTRNELVRALFLFAEGKPIGEEGIKWLKVHCANCWDLDKISKKPFAARIALIDASPDKITQVATMPLKDRWWLKGASKPFQFLAACIALSEAIEQGPSYCCDLPIAFDGSCNGLQHLCAMTKAPEGALVNLTPRAHPEDIYQRIADCVEKMIKNDLKNSDLKSWRSRHSATMWLKHHVDRSVVKRNVMTYGYSSTIAGMADQLREDLMAGYTDDVFDGKIPEHPFGANEGYYASSYLAKHVFKAVEDEIKPAADVKNFLRKLVSALASENKCLCWTAPTGLPWSNRYHEKKTRVVKLRQRNHGVELPKSVTEAFGFKTRIKVDKARNGVTPNFVHALDAAHLMRTVNAAAKEGITDIATVHDSYSCLPSQAARFRRIIREQFVRMYQEHDVLKEVYDKACEDLGCDEIEGVDFPKRAH